MMQQKRLLLILAGLLLLAIGYAFWASPKQERVTVKAGKRHATQTRLRGEKAPETVQSDRLRVDLMQPREEEYPGFKRNIFRSLFAQDKPKVKPKVKPKPKPTPPPKVVAPPPPEVTVQPSVAVREALARFLFIGFLEKAGERTIFLSAQDEIFLVQRGDRFGEGGKFSVLDISPEKLTLRQGDDPRLINIPLMEQAPLVPSF